jgi:hypothetical protein
VEPRPGHSITAAPGRFPPQRDESQERDGGECGQAGTAKAYVFNTTVVPPGVMRWMALWPQGTTRPLASSLTDSDGTVTNNMALVPSNNGLISAFVTDPTHLVLDIFGYFAP